MVLNIGIDGDEEELAAEGSGDLLERRNELLVVGVDLARRMRRSDREERHTNILHKEQNMLLDLAAKDAGRGVVGKLVDKREGLDLEECIDGGALVLAAVQRLAIVKLTQITG